VPADRWTARPEKAAQRAAARIGAAAILLGTLASCASKPEALRDTLEVTAPDQFRYVVTATMLHPLESSQAEHARMVGLAKRLAEHGLCPHGYEILSRDLPPALVRDSRFEYTVQDVTYVGRCKT
jgi:hypothetical protein